MENLFLRTEILYNIHFEFGVHVRVVKSIITYSERTSNKIYVGKWLSDAFPVQNNVKQEGGLYYSHLGSHCFQVRLRMFHQKVKKKTVVARIEWDNLGSGIC
jgi:hypothetical protein